MEWIKNKLHAINQSLKLDEATTLERLELENQFLEKVEYDDVDFFHLKGYECWAKVVKVYDGDTCTVVFFLNNKPFKFKLRLAGIDTAEKTSDDEMEVAWAEKAIDRLNELIGNDCLVYLKCRGWDKYGRLLGELKKKPEDQETFNQILLKEDLAYEYTGRTRQEFRKWAPWISWLDDPYYESPEDKKPVDNIQDSEVIHKEENETDKDFREETNVPNTMNKKFV